MPLLDNPGAFQRQFVSSSVLLTSLSRNRKLTTISLKHESFLIRLPPYLSEIEIILLKTALPLKMRYNPLYQTLRYFHAFQLKILNSLLADML